MMGPLGFSQGGTTQDASPAVVNNPIGVLLTPERLALLWSLSDTERQLFYGRVLESVFSNPTYQQIMLSTANYHLDQIAALRGGGGSQGGGAAAGGGSSNGSLMLA